MLQREIAQHELETQLAYPVAARMCQGDVVADHCLDAQLAARRAHQVIAELSGCDLGDVLVLGNGQHFIFGEIAQREAVFEAKHARRSD